MHVLPMQEEMNEEDKEFNRHIANVLIAQGILKDLDGGALPPRPAAAGERPLSAHSALMVLGQPDTGTGYQNRSHVKDQP